MYQELARGVKSCQRMVPQHFLSSSFEIITVLNIYFNGRFGASKLLFRIPLGTKYLGIIFNPRIVRQQAILGANIFCCRKTYSDLVFP